MRDFGLIDHTKAEPVPPPAMERRVNELREQIKKLEHQRCDAKIARLKELLTRAAQQLSGAPAPLPPVCFLAECWEEIKKP
jgi:hypothetical protein